MERDLKGNQPFRPARNLHRPLRPHTSTSPPTLSPLSTQVGPGVASLGLQPNKKTREAAELAGAGVLQAKLVAAERTVRDHPSVGDRLDHFRAAASTPPTPPDLNHTLSSDSEPCRRASTALRSCGTQPAPRCAPLSLAEGPQRSDAAGFLPRLTSSQGRHLLPLFLDPDAGATLSSELRSGKAQPSSRGDDVENSTNAR